MTVIILPNAKNIQNLVLLQMSIALQCGHTFQLRYCFLLLTLPLYLMKVPSGSLNLLSKGDFWSLCRILGTFYNQPFQLFPLHLAGFRGDDASLWNGAVFGIQLPKRSQKLPHKQPQLYWLWDNRVRDCCSEGNEQTELNMFCFTCFEILYLTLGVTLILTHFCWWIFHILLQTDSPSDRFYNIVFGTKTLQPDY